MQQEDPRSTRVTGFTSTFLLASTTRATILGSMLYPLDLLDGLSLADLGYQLHHLLKDGESILFQLGKYQDAIDLDLEGRFTSHCALNHGIRYLLKDLAFQFLETRGVTSSAAVFDEHPYSGHD